MDELNVILPSGKKIQIPYGTQIHALLAQDTPSRNPLPVTAALVNNELTSLSFRVKVDATIKAVYSNEEEGALIYRRSLSFLLSKAAADIFPRRNLVIGHSLGSGYFYHYEDGQAATDQDALALEKQMRELVNRDLPIQRRVLSYEAVVSSFKKQGRTDRTLLLKFRNEPNIPIYQCGDYWDVNYQPLIDSTGKLQYFEVRRYDTGLLLRYPKTEEPEKLPPMQDDPLLYSIYKEYKAWGKILNIDSVGKLNQKIAAREIKDFVRVAEALHNKKIAEIADGIHKRRGKVKVVLIAGPSSSGKTTFTKKLGIQLQVLGFNPKIIGLDNYFLPRKQTPLTEDGKYDFESLRAIDIDLLNRTLLDLFSDKETELPTYDFKSGTRKYTGQKLRMGDRSLLLMEGIHGLNPELTPLIKDDQKFRIYISALTQLNIDNANRIATTDNRLLRRIIRDHLFRGYDALTTLKMRNAVKEGEQHNIFPYQNEADAAFNSALDFELAVMKPLAEPLLNGIKPWHTEYAEARRLLNFLRHILPLEAKVVSEDSLLREFIGDSGFKY